MAERILVTGATGTVGAEVLAELQRVGAPVAAAVRDVGRARRALGDQIDCVPFDFAQPATYDGALAGVRRLFLMRPPAIGDARQLSPLIAAAQRAGVEHVVFLSLLGAERNPVVPHHGIEQELLASGMDWTFLRASFFMQNLSTTHRDDIRDGDVIFVPAGDGRTSFIDARDIGAVGALALTDDRHRNRAYPLTGDAALTYSEVAELLSQALGRPIRYPRPSLAAFALRMRSRGLPWPFILVMCGIYTTARLGLAGAVTPDTAQLLGRPPISVARFAQDYRSSWVRPDIAP
ncbi:MAG TPA: SDR family oxidoreductase [Roseiflexaceae bacterium]|nr:SDR family oxidoreductase [Roseiflexaceae bacterium]